MVDSKRMRVIFEVEPVKFSSVEDYSTEGHFLKFENGALNQIETELSCDTSLGRDEAIRIALDRLQPLLSLIEFGVGVPIKLGRTTTSVDEGLTLSGSAEPVVIQCVPFPTLPFFQNLTPERRRQVEWYNLASRAKWVVERIRNYYEVLELEFEISRANKSNNKYVPEIKLRWLRDACSHPVINLKPKAEKWLRAEICCNYVDPSNSEHHRFLEKWCRVLADEAHAVIERSVRWW